MPWPPTRRFGGMATSWARRSDCSRDRSTRSSCGFATVDLLEAKWEETPPAGRPPRHLYRLTAEGIEHAAALARPVGKRHARASARTARCVIAAVFVLGARGARGAVRDSGDRAGCPRRRRARSRLGGCLRSQFVGCRATGCEWGQAMLGELDQAQGRRARWRFSFGCAWAAGRIRLRSPEPGGAACAQSLSAARRSRLPSSATASFTTPGCVPNPTSGARWSSF